ncbi:MAG TPA: glutamyl-tRNA reductase [Actinobacteria bacterium]|nr:glutamyl-tRNA reductase [Actinomycetes bacterium]HEX21058.1 glutamyl-tRNA reductase [Actinomycetota bacterium]
MHIIASGLSHKTAPVEVREALNFPAADIGGALNNLLSYEHINEAIILSTCNRTEIYAVANDIEAGKDNIIHFFENCRKNIDCNLREHLYFYDSVSAIHHLFRVISSLDSMIIGEAQILGQVKEAYAQAFDNDATNIIFNRLFRQAFAVGKRVRTETDIGENAVSISYAAVQLAKKVFEDLTGKTVMIIGAGKMSELTAKHLLANGVRDVLIANRSYDNAVELAKTFQGKPVPFDLLFHEMVKADIVISSTGSSDYILDKEKMQPVIHTRRGRSIFLIDIAVPRDIDPNVNNLDNVYLYDIDDLQSVVDANLAERSREAKEAEKIITTEVREFLTWISSLEAVPTISKLRQSAERIRQAELAKAANKLADLSDDEMNAVNALTSAIINKLLHNPTIRMKESAKTKDGYLYTESMRHLFCLNESTEKDVKRKSETTSKIKIKNHKHVEAG